jgi:glycine cleavage system H protein
VKFKFLLKEILPLTNITYFYPEFEIPFTTDNFKHQTNNIMNIPTDLHFTKDHEWIKVDGNTAIVGITEFAQGELGDIVFVEIETVGSHLDKGSTFGTIEAVKTVSDLFMPVSGKVLEMNGKMNDSPDMINKDPYGTGWLIKIEIDDAFQLNDLMDAKAYAAMINV